MVGGALDMYALIDFPSYNSIILVVIARAILILCAISFYSGLLLPTFMKDIFIHENKEI